MAEIFPESPLTSLPEAVAFMGALPVPVGPQQPPFAPSSRTFEEKLGQDVARLQGLLAEAVRDAHHARSERDLMRERVSEPFGCKFCGAEKRSHGRRYFGSQGGHMWERPSDEQVKARMLARRVARSPLPAVPELEQLHDDLTGANLARWEEERTSERLRWALASAKRGRSRLRAQAAALLKERHETNAVQELRARQSCPCPPTDQPGPHQLGCPLAEVPMVIEFAVQYPDSETVMAETVSQDRRTAEASLRAHREVDAMWRGCRVVQRSTPDGPWVEAAPDTMSQAFAPVAALREVLDGEHFATVHHDYKGPGRDLDMPGTGGAL